MSSIEMSLEEIIRKRKKQSTIKNKNQDAGITSRKKTKPIAKNKNLPDARMKIISKKRSQITDARDKLADLAKTRDAREKLNYLRGTEIINNAPKWKKTSRNDKRKPRQFATPHFDEEHIKKFTAARVIGTRNNGKLRQTVSPRVDEEQIKKFTATRVIGTKNNVLKYIKTSWPKQDAMSMDIDDDDFVPQIVKRSPAKKPCMNIKIVAENTDARKHITSRTRIHTPVIKNPPQLQSILKKRPSGNKGSDSVLTSKYEPSADYRIIVSNLRTSVNKEDIEELFGDIGGMMEARMVRPGTAEIIYCSFEAAQKAVDFYDNRQLDGQPMNCLLVISRNQSNSAPKMSNVPASSSSNVEPDLSTFHKVLFNNF